jgi:hypothetical protein
MAESTMESGKTIKCMERESSLGKTEGDTKENTSKTSKSTSLTSRK